MPLAHYEIYCKMLDNGGIEHYFALVGISCFFNKTG